MSGPSSTGVWQPAMVVMSRRCTASTERPNLAWSTIASHGLTAPKENRAADAMGIAPETFAELHEILTAEQALRTRRYELIVAPCFPGHLDS
jgi:hypothetical protein